MSVHCIIQSIVTLLIAMESIYLLQDKTEVTPYRGHQLCFSSFEPLCHKWKRCARYIIKNI